MKSLDEYILLVLSVLVLKSVTLQRFLQGIRKYTVFPRISARALISNFGFKGGA